jgi:hypothetical protein
VQRLLGRLQGVRRGAQGFTARCPAHDDRHPSLSVAEGEAGRVLVFCHARQCSPEAIVTAVGLTLRDLQPDERAPQLEGLQEANDALLSAYTPEDARTAIDDAIPAAFHSALLNDAERLRSLEERRRISAETVAAYQLGFDGQRYTIPVRDEAGRCANIRRYQPDATDAQAKMISWRRGYGSPRLYPLDALTGADPIVLCAGEWDCLLARQLGLNAITSTGGESVWRPGWSPQFA